MKKALVLFMLLAVVAAAEEQATEGKVFVKTDPYGAIVFLYKKLPDKLVPVTTELGKAPCLVKLPLGKHMLYITLEGYDDEFLEVDIKDEKIQKPEPVALIQKKKPEFNVDIIFEEGWSISVDGKKLKDKNGKDIVTPATVPMQIGKHSISLNKAGFKEISKQATVTKAEALEIKEKPIGMVSQTIKMTDIDVKRINEQQWLHLPGTEYVVQANKVLEIKLEIKEQIMIVPNPNDKWSGNPNSKQEIQWYGISKIYDGLPAYSLYCLVGQRKIPCGQAITDTNEISLQMNDSDLSDNKGSIRVKVVPVK